MIKAVIFDCFGVLVHESWVPFRDAHFVNSDDRQWANQLMRSVSTGETPIDKFLNSIAEKSGVSVEHFRQVLYDNSPNLELFDYIANVLKPSYVIGLLSNVGENRLHQLLTNDQLVLIDKFALSSEIGVAKPSPEAYKIIIDKLGLTPKECIFVDDSESYCQGARDVGMDAIKYDDFRSFQSQLESMLAL